METAQQALTDFLEARKKLLWKEMKPEDQLAYLIEKEGLEIAAEQEAEANRIESNIAQETAMTAQKASVLIALRAKGYSGEVTKADWEKLFNRPEVFGANWQKQVDYHSLVASTLKTEEAKEYFVKVVTNYQ
jgi:hypothetical protein